MLISEQEMLALIEHMGAWTTRIGNIAAKGVLDHSDLSDDDRSTIERSGLRETYEVHASAGAALALSRLVALGVVDANVLRRIAADVPS